MGWTSGFLDLIETPLAKHLIQLIMHVVCNHSPYGPEIFSLQSLGICPALQGHFYWRSPAKSPAQMERPAGLAMDSKALQFHGTVGTVLSSKHGS